MWGTVLQKIKRQFQPDQSIFEQQREVIERAEKFDRLTALPVWVEVLQFMAEDVNGTLAESTKHKADPANMMWGVVRWDAKRELLDQLQAWIDSTLRERDRIVQEIRETNEYTGNTD